jgi:bifunctional non-homologous end joining protein LigD
MKIGGHDIEVSHADKILFPDAGLTKGDFVKYYARIGEMMLPHIKGRPLTLFRFPEGIGENGFFQKNASDYFPDWIERARLGRGDKVDYVVCRDRASLVYVASQVAVLHIWPARADKPDYPDRLIFDLDPSDNTPFDEVRSAAKSLSNILLDAGLENFPMTTGSRGLHVVTPLNRRDDFDTVRDFAREIAEILAEDAPNARTTEQRKAKRGDRLFIDTYRNAFGQTAVAPYSVRARPGAPIATPLEWDALDDAKLRSDRYTIKNIFRRLGQKADPWRDIDEHASSLAKARQRLDQLRRRRPRRRA